MTRATARTRLLLRLGNRPDATTDLLDAWLNDALIELTTRRVEIEDLQSTVAAISTTTGITDYTKPAGTFVVRYVEDTTNKRRLDPFPGGFQAFLDAKQNATNGKPTQFIEWGRKIRILPPPDADAFSLVPHVYALATWTSGAADVPSIGSEWDLGILSLAAMIAFRELGDDDRSVKALQEFADWLANRDTIVRQMHRFQAPKRGIQPAQATRRDPRTGV